MELPTLTPGEWFAVALGLPIAVAGYYLCKFVDRKYSSIIQANQRAEQNLLALYDVALEQLISMYVGLFTLLISAMFLSLSSMLSLIFLICVQLSKPFTILAACLFFGTFLYGVYGSTVMSRRILSLSGKVMSKRTRD